MVSNSAPVSAEEKAPRPGDTGLGLPVPQAADPIDQVIRLAPRWTLAVLVGGALVIASAIVWAFAGEITQTVSRPGVLRDSGYQTVKSTQEGVVARTLVKLGDQIEVGSPIVEFEGGSRFESPVIGHVASIYQTLGARVKIGDALIAITDYTTPNRVFVMLPVSMMGTVEAGLPVEVEFSNAPAASFGYAKGWIQTLGADPMTVGQLAQLLGIDAEIIAAAAGHDPGLPAMIGLESNLKNPSTLSWTVGKGPDFVPNQGTPVTVNVILKAQRPIDLLFPTGDTRGTGRRARG